MTERLGEVAQTIAQRPCSLSAGSRSDSTGISPRSSSSRPGMTRRDFSRSVAALVALKRSADLTPVQVEAWYGVLGGFPVRVLNAAVIEMALTKERFPEVGDLYAICRRSLPKEYVPLGPAADNDRPSKAEIFSVAERLGLDV